MKSAIWLSIVWCGILSIAGHSRASENLNSRGTVRERFQEAWKSRQSSSDMDALDILYWLTMEDVIDTKLSVSNLLDRQWFLARMKTAAADAGVTNYSSSDLERVYEEHKAGVRAFAVSLDLPVRIENWPAPNLAWTNSGSGVSSFIQKHGWSMYSAKAPFGVGMGFRTEPITGLPWREISRRTFSAVTYDGILFVVLEGFGPDSGGVAWNPRTNRFPRNISGFVPLGEGWYSWQQAGTATAKRYEGNVPDIDNKNGAENAERRISSGTNTTSPAGQHPRMTPH